MNSECEFIVATPAIFIGGGAPDWYRNSLYDLTKQGADLRRPTR
jgi:hypothetical protein